MIYMTMRSWEYCKMKERLILFLTLYFRFCVEGTILSYFAVCCP